MIMILLLAVILPMVQSLLKNQVRGLATRSCGPLESISNGNLAKCVTDYSNLFQSKKGFSQEKSYNAQQMVLVSFAEFVGSMNLSSAGAILPSSSTGALESMDTLLSASALHGNISTTVYEIWRQSQIGSDSLLEHDVNSVCNFLSAFMSALSISKDAEGISDRRHVEHSIISLCSVFPLRKLHFPMLLYSHGLRTRDRRAPLKAVRSIIQEERCVEEEETGNYPTFAMSADALLPFGTATLSRFYESSMNLDKSKASDAAHMQLQRFYKELHSLEIDCGRSLARKSSGDLLTTLTRWISEAVAAHFVNNEFDYVQQEGISEAVRTNEAAMEMMVTQRVFTALGKPSPSFGGAAASESAVIAVDAYILSLAQIGKSLDLMAAMVHAYSRKAVKISYEQQDTLMRQTALSELYSRLLASVRKLSAVTNGLRHTKPRKGSRIAGRDFGSALRRYLQPSTTESNVLESGDAGGSSDAAAKVLVKALRALRRDSADGIDALQAYLKESDSRAGSADLWGPKKGQDSAVAKFQRSTFASRKKRSGATFDPLEDDEDSTDRPTTALSLGVTDAEDSLGVMEAAIDALLLLQIESELQLLGTSPGGAGGSPSEITAEAAQEISVIFSTWRRPQLLLDFHRMHSLLIGSGKALTSALKQKMSSLCSRYACSVFGISSRTVDDIRYADEGNARHLDKFDRELRESWVSGVAPPDSGGGGAGSISSSDSQSTGSAGVRRRVVTYLPGYADPETLFMFGEDLDSEVCLGLGVRVDLLGAGSGLEITPACKKTNRRLLACLLHGNKRVLGTRDAAGRLMSGALVSLCLDEKTGAPVLLVGGVYVNSVRLRISGSYDTAGLEEAREAFLAVYDQAAKLGSLLSVAVVHASPRPSDALYIPGDGEVLGIDPRVILGSDKKGREMAFDSVIDYTRLAPYPYIEDVKVSNMTSWGDANDIDITIPKETQQASKLKLITLHPPNRDSASQKSSGEFVTVGLRPAGALEALRTCKTVRLRGINYLAHLYAPCAGRMNVDDAATIHLNVPAATQMSSKYAKRANLPGVIPAENDPAYPPISQSPVFPSSEDMEAAEVYRMGETIEPPSASAMGVTPNAASRFQRTPWQPRPEAWKAHQGQRDARNANAASSSGGGGVSSLTKSMQAGLNALRNPGAIGDVGSTAGPDWVSRYGSSPGDDKRKGGGMGRNSNSIQAKQAARRRLEIESRKYLLESKSKGGQGQSNDKPRSTEDEDDSGDDGLFADS